MVKWKNVLLGVALALPLAAAAGAPDANMDKPSFLPPPTADGSTCATPTGAVELSGVTQQYRCCWLYHMGTWFCYPC